MLFLTTNQSLQTKESATMSKIFVHQEEEEDERRKDGNCHYADSLYRSTRSYYTLTNLQTCHLPCDTDSDEISDVYSVREGMNDGLVKEIFDWIFNDVNRFIFMPVPQQYDRYIRCLLIRQRSNAVETIRLVVENSLDGSRVPLLLAEKEEKAFGQSRYVIRVISHRTEDFWSAELITDNITGTHYTLYALIDEQRRELANIQYETNIIGFNGPRKFQATLTNFDPHGPSSDGSIQVSNRTPYWDSSISSHALNFDGRRRPAIASMKNFQMTDNNAERNVLQFCRASEDHFFVDFRFPLSLIQTFGICLTSLESRWCRE